MNEPIPEAREAAKQHHGDYFDAMNTATQKDLIKCIQSACLAYAARENAELRGTLEHQASEMSALRERVEQLLSALESSQQISSELLGSSVKENAELRAKLADAEMSEDIQRKAKEIIFHESNDELDALIKQRDAALARAEAAERERDDWKTKWENLSDDALKEFELSGFLTDDAKSGEGFFDFLIRTRAERYAALARAEAAEKERDEAKKWSSVEEVTRLRILAEHNRKEWGKSIARAEAIQKTAFQAQEMAKEIAARAEAAEREDGGLVDQFLHSLLDEVTRRGIDMSSCDGEDPPEIVIAGWLCGYVSDIKQERDTALAEVARLRGVISETERKHFSTL